jgi:hypothetical protein
MVSLGSIVELLGLGPRSPAGPTQLCQHGSEEEEAQEAGGLAALDVSIFLVIVVEVGVLSHWRLNLSRVIERLLTKLSSSVL